MFKNKNKSNFLVLSSVLIMFILILSSTYADDCIWTPADIFDETFETNLLQKMDIIHAESLAFSILNNTEVFYSKGFGDQPGTDVAYHLNSASKMFTSTAILQLYEQGLIGLEDDFNDYLPYELKNPYYPDTKITIKQLLCHRSSLEGTIRGLEDYFALMRNGSYTFPSSIYEFFHENGTYYADSNWENWEPGTSFLYSDVGFDILTLILANITGIPFDTYVTQNILNPLGMTNTRFSAEDYTPEKIAIGYDWNQITETNEIAPYLNNSRNPGGGGYFSTTEDMAKYMLCHLNQGEYNGVSILNVTTIELMHTDVAYSKQGLGWVVRTSFGSRNDYQGHDGGPHYGFYTANFIRSTLGVVLFTNQGSWDLSRLGFEDICAYLFDLAHKLLTEKCSPTTPPPTTDDTNLFLLPIVSMLILFTIVHRFKKKKD